MRTGSWTYLAALAAISAACGGGGSSDDDGRPTDAARLDAADVDAPVTPTDATIDGSITTGMIGSAGGVLTTPDGVVLAVPPGALTADTMITITVITNDVPNGLFSRYFELSPDGLQFAEPFELTLPYDPALLGTHPTDELTLAYREASGDWRGTGFALVDTGAGAVTGYADHFSRWAIIPSPPGTNCRPDYNCFSSCCEAVPPDMCCSHNRNTCHCRSNKPFTKFVACYASCVSTDKTSNFANSTCMRTCCTNNGGTAPRNGVCRTANVQMTQAVLDCARACPAVGDAQSLCPGGPINFQACAWNASMSPGIGAGCSGAGSGLTSQFLYTDVAVVFAQSWGQGSPLQVGSGTVSASSVTAPVTCTAGGLSGSFAAGRSGSGYAGTWTTTDSMGNQNSGNLTLSPAW